MNGYRVLLNDVSEAVLGKSRAGVERGLDILVRKEKITADDKARMAKAHVPQEMIESADGAFATKPALALAMIKRAIAAKVPFAFVAADTVYGVGSIETALRCAGKGYVLGVKSTDPFNSWGKPQIMAGTAKETR